MAKKPLSSKPDPASLAFSAVENALKTTAPEPQGPLRANSGSGPRTGQNPSAPRAQAAKRIAAKTGSVANDDRFSPASVLYGLGAKPSAAPLWIASALSLAWIAITGFGVWNQYNGLAGGGQDLAAIFGTLDFAGAVAVILLPVLGFFAVAILARRAQDLRIAAASMTRAAVRLAEPETTAADKIATVGQAVRREVTALADGLERALSRAGELEVMIHNEVTVLDKTYSENESRMRGLIQELASQRDSVITNSERVREAISESHSGLVFDLDMIAQRIAGTIQERGNELTSAMNNAGNVLQQSFGEKSTSFISLVDGRTTELLSALDDSAGRLNLALEERTSSVSAAFEERTHELASVIDMRMNAITEALDTRAVSLNEAIGERTAAISSVLRDDGGKMLSDLRDHGQEVGGALDAIGLRIANEISTRAGEAEVTMTRLTGQMEEMVSTQINAMQSRMHSAVLEISATVDESSEQARLSLVGAGAQSLAQFETRVDEVSLVIDTRIKSFDNVISEKGDILTNALENYTSGFASRANVLELALDEKTGRFNDQISQRTREMAATITGRADQITQTLAQRTETLTSVLDGTTGQISSVIETRTQELANAIEQHGANARDKIDISLQNVTETMDSRSSELTQMITVRVSEVNDSLGRGIDNAIARINDAETGINARVDAAAATVNQSASLTADLIEAGVSSARKAITDVVDQRLGTLPEAITARADITADRLASLNETISNTMNKTSSELETSATRIEETINQRIVVAARGLSGDVEQSAARMDVAVRAALEKITGVADRFESLVRIDAAQSAENLGQQVEQISRTLSEKTGQFAHLVSQKSAELNTSLQSHGNILSEALQANAQEAQTIMSATTSRMMSEVTGALEKLNQSNVLLQQVLEASTTNLATLESNVANQTASYSATVRDALSSTEQAGQLVSEHVGAMQVTIRAMMEEFNSMVGKLDGEAANVDRAAQHLSEAGNGSLEAVQARREAMDALAAGFTARADDIDTRLRSFALSIADTVNETEQRLVLARKAMDEALSSTTDVVTNRIEGLARAASDEGARTGEALEQTQKAMLAEMQEALGHATRRFNETAQSMQDTAAQVGSELEATRSELQRGFLELPEETRLSAAAMRSVVAEQIEALHELNSIVLAQPASHDVSRVSVAPPAPPPQRPLAPPVAPAPASVAPAPAPAPQPMRQSAAAPAAHNITGADMLGTLTRPGPTAIPTVPAPVPAPAAAPAPTREAGNGWLRDVLRNASASQQQATAAPRAAANPISNLTSQIAHAIDEYALGEAWQRYQDGETGVFSRRIYTLTGQGTYDEVRKKLQRDPEFARTTREYVAEFEQLLQTAKSPAEARRILTSDRGKVFTMLAHASGRIN